MNEETVAVVIPATMTEFDAAGPMSIFSLRSSIFLLRCLMKELDKSTPVFVLD